MSAGSRFVRLFLSQLGYKLLSFGLTSLLTRALAPKAKGVGFFFEMYFLAVGFVSREAIRSLHARLPYPTTAAAASASNNVDDDDEEDDGKNSSRSHIRKAFRGSGLVCALVALVLFIPLAFLHASYTMNDELRGAIEGDVGFTPLAVLLTVALLMDLLAETHWNISLHCGSYLCGDCDDDGAESSNKKNNKGGGGGGRGIEGRATAESIGLLCKTITTTCLVYGARFSDQNNNNNNNNIRLSLAAVAFALGHLAYGIVQYVLSCHELAKCYGGDDDKKRTSVSSSSSSSSSSSCIYMLGGRLCLIKPSMDNTLAALHLYTRNPSYSSVMSQFVQENMLRLVLTEGEKFVLSSVGAVSLSAQGAYDAATGLGALVARLLFRLWEEFAFNEWARHASVIASSSDQNNTSAGTTEKEEGDKKKKQKEDDTAPTTAASASAVEAEMKQCLSLLHNMCRVAVIVGVLSCTFGPLLAGRVLQTLYGSGWANQEAASILSTFLLVMPLFGVNGLVEAFGRALCSAEQLRRTRAQLLVVTVLYLGASVVALQQSGGDVRALIVVNGIQFCIRIAIGVIAAKRVVDEKMMVMKTGEEEKKKKTNNSNNISSSTWFEFLAPFAPSSVFIGFNIAVIAVGWMSFAPKFSSASTAEGGSGRYENSLKNDLTVVGVGVVSVLVAAWSEPEVVGLVRGLLRRRSQ